MKFNSYKLLALFCVITATALHASDKESDLLAVEISAQPMMVDIQAQMSHVMDNLYELIMPDYKVIYKKYYFEIEWLEHNYVVYREEGNIILNTIAFEFQNVIMEKLDSFFDIILAQTNAPATVQEREAFKTLMVQMMPLMITQGLMKNAELKSSVYQEIMAEEK